MSLPVAIIVSVCLVVVVIVVVIVRVVLWRKRQKSERDPDVSVIELPSVENPSSVKGTTTLTSQLLMSSV